MDLRDEARKGRSPGNLSKIVGVSRRFYPGRPNLRDEARMRRETTAGRGDLSEARLSLLGQHRDASCDAVRTGQASRRKPKGLRRGRCNPDHPQG